MALFALEIANVAKAVGINADNIYVKSSEANLPGFYRPSKQWDVLIVVNKKLLVAIELKSHVGSLGNNFNNRTEEAMGTALDLWTAYREGGIQTTPPPWLGYLLLLEDSVRARTPVRVNEPHFSVLPEFKLASYAQRYELFCRKLVQERQYNAACFMMSDKDKADEEPNYWEPTADLGATAFLSQMAAHLVGAAAVA